MIEKGCPKCGRILKEEVEVCPYCGYKFAQIRAYYEHIQNEKYEECFKYAGIIKRVVAFLLDFWLVSLFVILLSIVIGISYFPKGIPGFLVLILILIIFIIYKVSFEASPLSSTIGKKVVGIKIINDENLNIGIKKAIIRNASYIFLILTFGIGIIMGIFSKDSSMLHDKISKTYVVNDDVEANDDYAPAIIRLMAFIIDVAILYFIMYLLNMGFNYLNKYFILPEEITQNSTTFRNIIFVSLVFIYFVFSESSWMEATLGKRMLGIKVTKINGDRMKLATSIYRFICLPLEIVTLGFAIIITDKRKQTLKDKIAETIVTRI
jgi:uncharacterized RDD family membrane protein YckC